MDLLGQMIKALRGDIPMPANPPLPRPRPENAPFQKPAWDPSFNGVMNTTMDMAPGGIKWEQMRPSTNVEDLRPYSEMDMLDEIRARGAVQRDLWEWQDDFGKALDKKIIDMFKERGEKWHQR